MKSPFFFYSNYTVIVLKRELNRFTICINFEFFRRAAAVGIEKHLTSNLERWEVCQFLSVLFQ